jgi:hypothetical protein
LLDEQVEEVERRLADPDTTWITAQKVRERLRKLAETAAQGVDGENYPLKGNGGSFHSTSKDEWQR